MGLYEKIYNVMCDSEAVEKSMIVGSGKNSYKAVSEAAMLNMVKPLFKKYKLIIFPVGGEIKDNVMTWDKTDYDGKTSQTLRAMTELKVTYRILDVENGEFQDVVGFGNGADSQDKGAGKAFTYSLKNALSKTFMLFSGEDTDNTHSDDINKSPQKPQDNSKPQDNTNTPTDTISEAQAKRLFGIAKGKADLVKTILMAHKYTASNQVLKAEYEKICKEIENLVKGA